MLRETRRCFMEATFGQNLRVVSQREALHLPCLGGLLNLGNTAVHRRRLTTRNKSIKLNPLLLLKFAGFGGFDKLHVSELAPFSCLSSWLSLT